MIKILSACGTGINSSTQIKNAIVKEMKNRGYDVKGDATVLSAVNPEKLKNYDIFTPVSEINFSSKVDIPVVVSGPILYRMPSMAKPVYDEVEEVIKEILKNK